LATSTSSLKGSLFRASYSLRFLDRGADANARDFDNHTPLWLALNQPAITAGPGFSGPVDTREATDLLRAGGTRVSEGSILN